MTTDTRTRLHHAAAKAVAMIAKSHLFTRHESNVFDELRAALDADTERVALTDGTTPGPWALLAEKGCTLVVASAEPQIDGKAFGIAIIPHHEGADRIPWETKEANAALIASAPTMRDELRAWREACSVGRLDALEMLIEEARSVIASDVDRQGNMVAPGEALLTALRALAAGDAGKGGGA